jgi:hypothetical protein
VNVRRQLRLTVMDHVSARLPVRRCKPSFGGFANSSSEAGAAIKAGTQLNN